MLGFFRVLRRFAVVIHDHADPRRIQIVKLAAAHRPKKGCNGCTEQQQSERYKQVQDVDDEFSGELQAQSVKYHE